MAGGCVVTFVIFALFFLPAARGHENVAARSVGSASSVTGFPIA